MLSKHSTMAHLLARMLFVPAVLFAVEFFSEMVPDIANISTPDIAGFYGVPNSYSATGVLVALNAFPAIVTPPLLVMADYYPRKWFVCSGILGMGFSCLLAGLAGKFWLFLIGILMWGAFQETASQLAEGTLMTVYRAGAEAKFSLWSLAGVLGNVLAPIFLVALAGMDLHWPVAFVAIGCVILVYGLYVSIQPFPEQPLGREKSWRMILSELREAMTIKQLYFWLVGLLLWELQDKVFIAFGSVYLHVEKQLDFFHRGLAFGAYDLGAMAGLLITNWLLSITSPAVLLLGAGIGSAFAYYFFWACQGFGLIITAISLFGFLTACFYPIMKVQAFKVLPRKPGTVAAINSVFDISLVVAPVMFGSLAHIYGINLTMIVLGLAPVGVALLAAVWHFNQY